MSPVVQPEDIETYRRDGAVCVRGVLTPGEAAVLRDRCMAAVPHAGDPGVDLRDVMMLATKVDDFWSVCGELSEVAAGFMGATTVRYFNDHLFVKEAGISAPSGFHQDAPYFPLRGEDIVSLWVGLSYVDQQSSPLLYVAGSHRGGPTRPEELGPCPDYFDSEVAAGARFLSWETEPGDVLVHHPFIVHGARANESRNGETRVALSVRFLGDDIVWDPRENVPLPEVLPSVAPGEYPADDVFPVVWKRSGS